MNQHEEERSQRFEDSAEKRLHSAHCVQQQEQHLCKKTTPSSTHQRTERINR